MRYWGLERNVAALVNYNPRALAREQRVESFTIEQARRFADTMKGDAYRDALIVALNTGMREGEVLGLTWDNVLWDEDPLLIRVKWQLARREHPTWQLDYPKTKKSERDVAMNPLVFDILSQRRDRAPFCVPVPVWNTDRTVNNLVFTNGKGRPILPETFKPALAAAELPEFDIHDLRHTFTSLCLDYGVPLEVLSDVLGHGSIRQTKDTYGHLARKTLSQAPDAIHSMLNGKGSLSGIKKPEPVLGASPERSDAQEESAKAPAGAQSVRTPASFPTPVERVLGSGKVG
jgi:integrase